MTSTSNTGLCAYLVCSGFQLLDATLEDGQVMFHFKHIPQAVVQLYHNGGQLDAKQFLEVFRGLRKRVDEVRHQ